VSLVRAHFLLNSVYGVEGKLFSPSRKQHNNKESLATDLFEWLNFEQSFFKAVFLRNSLQNFIKNNLCKVSRRRARDWDPSRPRRDRDFKKLVSRRVSRLHHCCKRSFSLSFWEFKTSNLWTYLQIPWRNARRLKMLAAFGAVVPNLFHLATPFEYMTQALGRSH